ncbi:MAG TPA: hypothetical protein VKB34_11340 [Povalibacter sp.]|nr:hypothetical protein [Povalibacter sp.]
MWKLVVLLMLFTGGVVRAADTPVSVDLRDERAVARLQQTNPGHYEKIRQILHALSDEPQRATSDWLQTTFGVSDVEISHNIFRTSLPARQTLRFRLDDVHYTMDLARPDLIAEPLPATRPEKLPPRQ